MNGKLIRVFLRWLHILGALLIGSALYSPLKENPNFMAVTLYFVVPIVALTGVMMWKQNRFLKLVKQVTTKHTKAYK